jgi:hypothetical protein
MLKPLNDLAKVQIETDEFGFGGKAVDKAQSGILIELPDQFNYFGFWSFAFEDSFMAKEKLEVLYKYWKSKIGHRVYWTALAEKGNILRQDKKIYAFVKLTSLIASDEDVEKIAENVLDDNGGAFSV